METMELAPPLKSFTVNGASRGRSDNPLVSFSGRILISAALSMTKETSRFTLLSMSPVITYFVPFDRDATQTEVDEAMGRRGDAADEGLDEGFSAGDAESGSGVDGGEGGGDPKGVVESCRRRRSTADIRRGGRVADEGVGEAPASASAEGVTVKSISEGDSNG